MNQGAKMLLLHLSASQKRCLQWGIPRARKTVGFATDASRRAFPDSWRGAGFHALRHHEDLPGKHFQDKEPRVVFLDFLMGLGSKRKEPRSGHVKRTRHSLSFRSVLLSRDCHTFDCFGSYMESRHFS